MAVARMAAFRGYRRRAVAAALVLAVAVASAGCSTGRDAVDETAAGRNRYVPGDGTVAIYEPGKRKAAPKLAGELLAGGRFERSTVDGKVLVVNFWASWCAPCRVETAELVKVYEATHADGVAFLGINIRDEREKATAFEKAHKVPYPSLFDPASRAALTFRDVPPTAVPVTVVIDRQGRVAAMYLKAVLVEDLQPVVERVAAEPPKGR